MENGDQRFESYLREFEPRRPRALPAAVAPRFEWRRLAAAAAVLIAVAGSTLFAVRQRQAGGIGNMTPTVEGGVKGELTAERASVFSLTQAALQDPARLDADLTEQSRRMLPDFRAKESTLGVLAKE